MAEKTVLITGAAQRIGAVIAEYLHTAGMDMIIHYNTSAEEAHELVRRMNQRRHDSAITVQADLRHKEYYTGLIEAALVFKGKVDVLINNASAFFPTPVQSLSDDDWNALININLKAPLFLSKLAAESLYKHKGCIINITDIHACRPLAEHTIYSVSKAGLAMLTRSMAKEMAPVRVNAISPGAIIWPEGMGEDKKQDILSKIALQRTGAAEDVAKTARFLIENALYITGQIINVDGGRTLYS